MPVIKVVLFASEQSIITTSIDEVITSGYTNNNTSYDNSIIDDLFM